MEKALTTAAARNIVSHCIREARAVKEISDLARLPLASTYRHVAQLAKEGVLVIERSALTADGKPFDLYRSRIRSGRIEVGPAKVQVTWEPNLAIEDRLIHLWEHFGG